MRGKKLMNRFVEIFVIETLTRAFEEKNAKNAEIICKGSGVGCRVVEPS